jgi:hypothetical protein
MKQNQLLEIRAMIQKLIRYCLVTTILLIVVQLITGSGCAARNASNPQKTKEEKRQASERRIAELAKKHGANTSWPVSISGKTDLSEVFIFQRQEAFEQLIGHPILALVSIVDIYRVKDGYRLICIFSLDNPQSLIWGNLYFVLDLPTEKAQQLADTSEPGLFGNFALVTVPSRVDVEFNRALSAEKPASIDDEVSVSVGELSGELWIKGTYLEMENMADY